MDGCAEVIVLSGFDAIRRGKKWMGIGQKKGGKKRRKGRE